MIRLLISFILLLLGLDSFAQHAYFATKGSIQYEKVVYTKARMRDLMAKHGGNRGMMYMGNIDEMPESSTSNFLLQFDETQTVMSPIDMGTPVKSTMTAPSITKVVAPQAEVLEVVQVDHQEIIIQAVIVWEE